MTGYVYVITNTVNGKQYVGQTWLGIEARWRQHVARARKHLTECSALYPAMCKHGSGTFVISEHASLEHCSQQQLDNAERNTINELCTLLPNGYNITSGGFGGGPLHPDTKAKLRAFNLGKVLTPEHRAKMSAARRGHVCSAETREKIGTSQRGRKRPLEVIAKIRALALGRKATPQARANMSAAQKGRVFTPAWCAKISAAKRGRSHKGHEQTEATKAKLRVACSIAAKGKPHWSKRLNRNAPVLPF